MAWWICRQQWTCNCLVTVVILMLPLFSAAFEIGEAVCFLFHICTFYFLHFLHFLQILWWILCAYCSNSRLCWLLSVFHSLRCSHVEMGFPRELSRHNQIECQTWKPCLSHRVFVVNLLFPTDNLPRWTKSAISLWLFAFPFISFITLVQDGKRTVYIESVESVRCIYIHRKKNHFE